jgi:hypothetical protein
MAGKSESFDQDSAILIRNRRNLALEPVDPLCSARTSEARSSQEEERDDNATPGISCWSSGCDAFARYE